MEQITARRALELITDVVDRAGEDFVYEHKDMTDLRGSFEYGGLSRGCRYVEEGHPSCLVGHVLVRAGVAIETLNKLDVLGVSAKSLADYGVRVDGKASNVLCTAQRVQDSGKSWGEALRMARQMYEQIMEAEL